MLSFCLSKDRSWCHGTADEMCHRGTAAWAWLIGHGWIGCGLLGFGRRRGDVEQLAGENDVVSLRAACQQTVVLADGTVATVMAV
jgi:hypothetical protein